MIVITGGIGSGKSVVSRILRLRGYGVYDCDYRAKVLMETDSEINSGIRRIAGSDAFNDDGSLNRLHLAEVIFGSREKRQQINQLVHAAVRKDIEMWLKEKPENLFVETAIAVESGLAALAKEVWMVRATPETRIRRVGERDSREEEEIMKIIEAQKREEAGLKEMDIPVVFIDNNPSDYLMGEIDKALIKYS